MSEVKKQEKKQGCIKLLQSLGKFLSPIVYLSIWYLFLVCISKSIPTFSFNPETVLVLASIIYILGLVTKSTSWSIGHEKIGLKGDSRSRIINFHKSDSGDFWFDLFADNPDLLENKEIQEFIKELTK